MNDDISTRPKSQALFGQVRARILEGHHPPGQWLKQADLEAQYGATRSEVRAVLSSLAERGIVEYVRNRGFRVYARTESEIADIVEMIVALEGAAARHIAERADPDSIAELEQCADEFERLIRSGNLADLRIANYRFHERVIALCGNARLARTVRNLRECCASGPEARYATFDGLQQSNREHHDIIAAIRAGDAGGLETLMRAHATQSGS